MYKYLQLFNQNELIQSGGAEVVNYKFEFYKKTYNQFLENDYDKRNPFTVNDKIHYKNEKKYLKILEKYNISPIIIDNNDNSLIITNCGDQLNINNIPANWKQQILCIYEILKKENIYHNDIKPDNFTVKNNKIYLIDFGWSTKIVPGYPYLNLTSNIIHNSNTINELFNKIYNNASSLILTNCLNFNKYINETLRNKKI